VSRTSPNSSAPRHLLESPAPPAGFWIRAAAGGVDLAAGLAASLALAPSVGIFFARRAVVTLRIGDPDTLWQGPLPLLLGLFGEVVYLLPFTLLLAWLLDPLTGATAGKRLFGLRVRAHDGRPATRPTLWRRSAVQTVGLWGWTLALLTGRWEIAALASLAGGVVVAGSLAALGPASLALHDRLSRTSVRRRYGRRPSRRNQRRDATERALPRG
jgi:uncharacterized RDD family membrane protein YckC